MIFFISVSAQAIASLVGVPVTALAIMLGSSQELVMSCTLSDGGAGQPYVWYWTPSPRSCVLRIAAQHGVVLELLVGGQVEGVARHDVLVVLLPFAEQVADPLLGRVDVLAELPDPDVPRRVGLVAPVRAAEAPVVIDAVGGDQLALLGHDVGADRIVDPAR